MVKAPNIAHLRLDIIKQDTNLKYFAQPNKVTIILYFHRVRNETLAILI